MQGQSGQQNQPKLCLPAFKGSDLKILSAAFLHSDLMPLLCASPAPPCLPPSLPQPRRLFPRSLIGNWSCLTGSDSLRCCSALSVVMWRSVFIGNLHKSPWGK